MKWPLVTRQLIESDCESFTLCRSFMRLAVCISANPFKSLFKAQLMRPDLDRTGAELFGRRVAPMLPTHFDILVSLGCAAVSAPVFRPAHPNIGHDIEMTLRWFHSRWRQFNLRALCFFRVCLFGDDFTLERSPVVVIQDASFDEKVLKGLDGISIPVTWSDGIDGKPDSEAAFRFRHVSSAIAALCFSL